MKDQAMRIEEERARLQEEAEALRERCDTDEHPSHEEMREFGEKGAAFARETLPPAAAGSGPCVTEQRENGDGHSAVPTRWQVAVHEAAHAVYAHRQGFGVL